MSQVALHNEIEAVASAAALDDCSLETLSNAFSELSGQLDQADQAALAYISETVSQSCADAVIDAASARVAVIDLCSRMLQCLDTNDPFDFNDVDDQLMKLLFPPEPTAPGDDVQQESVTSGESAVLEGETVSALESVDESPNSREKWEDCQCDDEDLLRQFLSEASEHLGVAEQLLLNLEESSVDVGVINELFRAVHSVKGASGVVELPSLTEISHLTEGVLVRVREGEIELGGHEFAIVLIAIDFLNQQIDSLHSCFGKKKPLRSPSPPAGLIECLDITVRTGKCPAEKLDSLQEVILDDRDGEAHTSKTPDTMRVDGKRLEQLLDLIGELIITESAVQRLLDHSATLEANSLGSRLRTVVRDVQQLSLSLKMVPVGTVLMKMNRMVRDLSAKLEKPCQLVIEGGETEVDKTLLESLADPLVHLVRNSLDHGIEDCSQERIDAGKPEVATIRVEAEHRSGSILIHVRDDGRGLDRTKIHARAIEKGVVSQSKMLTDTEIDQLIFEPGFSTAEEVSEISGRGVGMDVVRQNVESMRGSISIHSEPEQGTAICLELPLTLSIIDGTVVRVGKQAFIIPTLSVVEQVQASSLEYSRTGSRTLTRYRDRFIDASELADVVGADRVISETQCRVCVIVESGKQRKALLVDEVVGQQPIVIKPLGGVLEAFDTFAGGALLPGGDVAFVLDLNVICKSTTNQDQTNGKPERVQ